MNINFKAIGPSGLEDNIGERTRITFPKKDNIGLRNGVWGRLEENPLNYSDNCADYCVRIRRGDLTGRYSKYIPIEHGSNIRIHTLKGIFDYVFIDDSD